METHRASWIRQWFADTASKKGVQRSESCWTMHQLWLISRAREEPRVLYSSERQGPQWNLLEITAQYIPGLQNFRANFLSRHHLLKGEWLLNPTVFAWITPLWSCPQVDLMLTRVNTKLLVFFSWSPCLEALAIYAFSQNWKGAVCIYLSE